jgi:hypothetical protein
MTFAAYNSNGVRLLCGALADSLEYVRALQHGPGNLSTWRAAVVSDANCCSLSPQPGRQEDARAHSLPIDLVALFCSNPLGWTIFR